MHKEIDVEFSWISSPSPDIVTLEAILTVNGQAQVKALTPTDQQLMFTFKANDAFQFKLRAVNRLGQEAFSLTISDVIGNLEAPLPPSNLSWRYISAPRDVADPGDETGGGQEFGVPASPFRPR